MAAPTCETSNNVEIEIVGEIVSVGVRDDGAEDLTSLGLLDTANEGADVATTAGASEGWRETGTLLGGNEGVTAPKTLGADVGLRDGAMAMIVDGDAVESRALGVLLSTDEGCAVGDAVGLHDGT